MTGPAIDQVGGGQIDRLFVYGTLRPGDVRWPILEPFVAGPGTPDGVDGRLFDTGRGYPAAVFEPRAGTIVGMRYRLRADRVAEALDVLDGEERSVPGGYHRVLVTTHVGLEAWAYAYGAGLGLTPIEGGDWSTR